MAAGALGHNSTWSTAKYINASSADAAEQHQELIASLRKEARQAQRTTAPKPRRASASLKPTGSKAGQRPLNKRKS
jgi:hypothetical protein